MAKSFTAQLRNISQKTEEKMIRIARQSIDDVVADAQTPVAKGGSMPVDKSFLRNSLISSVNGAQVAKGGDTYTLAIAQLKPGDYLRFGWSADYARARHYKPEDFGQGGGMWRDKAAAKWQSIVDKNTRRAK